MTAVATQPTNDGSELTTLRSIRDQVLALGSTADVDTMRAVNERVSWAKAFIREVQQALDEANIEWIEANGDLELDEDRRLYVGVEKKIKPRDDAALIDALLTATGGDMEEFCKVLASGWIKPGACRPLLGDQFDKHFETTETPDVKTGKPKRGVMTANKRFSK